MLETDNYREIPLPQQSQEAPILHVQLLAGFWLGWTINSILTLLLIALMVWLKFFWHW
jgi:hypothetical protein